MRIIAVCNKFDNIPNLKDIISEIAGADTELQGFLRATDALQYARGHPIDVAFVDLDREIPHMPGLILAQKLQMLYPSVNIIFMSETNEYCTDAWSIHASDYLRKPVQQERVARAMAHLRHRPVK